MWQEQTQGHLLIHGGHYSLHASHLSGNLMCRECFVRYDNVPLS